MPQAVDSLSLILNRTMNPLVECLGATVVSPWGVLIGREQRFGGIFGYKVSESTGKWGRYRKLSFTVGCL